MPRLHLMAAMYQQLQNSVHKDDWQLSAEKVKALKGIQPKMDAKAKEAIRALILSYYRPNAIFATIDMATNCPTLKHHATLPNIVFVDESGTIQAPTACLFRQRMRTLCAAAFVTPLFCYIGDSKQLTPIARLAESSELRKLTKSVNALLLSTTPSGSLSQTNEVQLNTVYRCLPTTVELMDDVFYKRGLESFKEK